MMSQEGHNLSNSIYRICYRPFTHWENSLLYIYLNMNYSKAQINHSIYCIITQGYHNLNNSIHRICYKLLTHWENSLHYIYLNMNYSKVQIRPSIHCILSLYNYSLNNSLHSIFWLEIFDKNIILISPTLKLASPSYNKSIIWKSL